MIRLGVLAILVFLPQAAVGWEKAVLWSEPVDLTTRDLTYGSGGKEKQPAPPFTFVKEDLGGTNPKFDVTDGKGAKWKVKLGEEARPEVAASRFVWATGYFTDDDYFLPTIRIEGLPGKLKRGQQLRLPGDTFASVRLKASAKGEKKKEGVWKWQQNSFRDTREWNGLRTLMAVINNWDLKDENNSVLQPKGEDPETYLVSDLGASFGTDHAVHSHQLGKGNLGSYQKSRFVRRKEGQFVDFGTPGRPSFLFLFNPHEYCSRVRMERIGQKVPVADARWMGTMLGRLTPAQVRDAFRTSGFSADQCEAFAKVFETRVAELKGL